MARSLLALLMIGCIEPDGPAEPAEKLSLIGTGDGSPESVEFTYILGTEEKVDDPRDIGFDADGNLWIANRSDDRTFIVYEPGTGNQDYDRRKDGYALHFMEETAALAFDTGTQFASCGESNNTYDDAAMPGNGYMGPALWTTDLDVFGVEDPIGLGSHLDMTHETPLCVGIAWESANVYWVFDGDKGNLVRNDFAADHGIGMDEHFDQVLHRFAEPDLLRVEEAPGHIVIDHEANRIYVADTGNGRVLWVDMLSGVEGRDMPTNDPGAIELRWDEVVWGEVSADFDAPGGLALANGHLFVGDWGTGEITEMDLEGNVIRTLDTGFGPESLHGIEIGPDGKLWVVDMQTGVYRIDP